MVIERHPSLQALSLEDKLQLSEELCMDAMLDVDRDPGLRARVAERLTEYRDDPDSGISWDEVKQRILSGKKIA